MKRIALLFVAIVVMAFNLQAKVAYLLPNSTDVNSPVGDVYDYLPWEGDGLDPTHEVSPERRAYEYFTSLYGAQYVTIKDVKEGKLLTNSQLGDITTLWVNVDRWGLTLEDFDAMFDGDFATALSNFVKAGGNVYLTKQATRLVAKMGRAKWYPNDYNSNGYFDAEDEWQMCIHFCTNGNVNHKCMTYMENGQKQDELDFITRYPIVSGSGKYRRSDNNCAWGDFGLYAPEKGGCDSLRRVGIENGMNCKVLGGWGHTRGMDYAGFIEFYPDGDYKGTVMAMGLAAYQWGPQNLSEYNIKNLTKGILAYLNGSAYWNEGKQPKDGVVGSTDEETNRYGSDFSGYSVTAVSSNPAVADIEGCAACANKGQIWYNGIGEATITATYVGDGVNSCKTPKYITQTITVTGGDAGAQYMYLLHTPLNSVVEDAGDMDEKPEVHAANWFYNDYVKENTGRFVLANEIPTDAADVKGKVLWINVDRIITEADFDAMFPVEAITKIADFAKNGGNLYLTGYAAKLAKTIGRVETAPTNVGWNIAFGTYENKDDNWLVNANMTDMEDRHTYGIYSKMAEGSYIDNYRYQMQHSENKKRSDRNCLWGFASASDLQAWESTYSAQALGGWGHTQDVTGAGIAEFFPTDPFKGTIITNGLAACSFASDNNYVHHVKNLTKGALNYLGQTSPFNFTWLTEPQNGTLSTTQDVKVEHKANSTLLFQVLAPNADKASFGEVTMSEDGDSATLTLNKIGENIIIKVLRQGDGKLVPKNVEYSIEKQINIVAPVVSWTTEPGHAAVTEDKPAAQATATSGTTVKYRSSDATIASIDENTGKITYLKEGKCDITAYTVVNEVEYATAPFELKVGGLNIIWETEPAATAIVGSSMSAVAKVEYGSATVQYELTNCTYSDGQLHFATEGTAKVKPFADAYGVKYYGTEKSITVTTNITTYERNTTAGKYGTICLERTSVSMSGATFYRPLYKTPDEGPVTSITLEEVTELTAGVGYFFLANAGTVSVTMNLLQEALTEPVDNGALTNGMHGNFTGTVEVPYNGEKNEMILSNNQLWYGEGNTIGEHRAWIKMNEVPKQSEAQPVAGRRRISMVVNQPSTPTGMNEQTKTKTVTKYIENGQLYFNYNGATYNALGGMVK